MGNLDRSVVFVYGNGIIYIFKNGKWYKFGMQQCHHTKKLQSYCLSIKYLVLLFKKLLPNKIKER